MSETARLALARDIARRLPAASHDELRLVDRVLQRLELGRSLYGPLDVSKPRDWRRERFEERMDALVYDVAGELALEDRARAGMHEAARAEMVDDWNPGQRTVASPVPAAIAVAIDDMRDSSSGPYLAIKVDDPTRKR